MSVHEESPAQRVSTPVDGVEVLGALSPSRASEFTSCALRYRFRTIDQLPDPPSRDALRGTLVHQVLQDLFDLPATARTPERALAMLAPAFDELLTGEPEAAEMFEDAALDVAQWLGSCRDVLARYFTLEDPRRLEPAERELYVETVLDSRLLLRGYVDRIDVAADGAVRIVDYKTGRSPAVGFEERALFQMKFYALVVWLTRGVVPAMLQLVYLGDAEIVRYVPDERDLRSTERKIQAIWEAIQLATRSGDWQPNRGVQCTWCAHQALCPAWGGTPPPLPPAPGAVASRSLLPLVDGA